MAEDRASIDGASVLDDAATRRVEFAGEVGGDWYAFGAGYAVLEALGGAPVDGATNVVALFDAQRDAIARAAARALARSPGTGGRIDVSEADIL